MNLIFAITGEILVLSFNKPCFYQEYKSIKELIDISALNGGEIPKTETEYEEKSGLYSHKMNGLYWTLSEEYKELQKKPNAKQIVLEQYFRLSEEHRRYLEKNHLHYSSYFNEMSDLEYELHDITNEIKMTIEEIKSDQLDMETLDYGTYYSQAENGYCSGCDYLQNLYKRKEEILSELLKEPK